KCPLVNLRLHAPSSGRKLLAREEARAAILHGEQRLAVNCSFKTKSEQMCIALTEEMVDANIVTDGFTGLWQPAVESNARIEQPVDRQAARNEIDSQVS